MLKVDGLLLPFKETYRPCVIFVSLYFVWFVLPVLLFICKIVSVSKCCIIIYYLIVALGRLVVIVLAI